MRYQFLIVVLACLVPTVAIADVAGAARVIDGDTLEIQNKRIQLFAVEAPEKNQTCGEQRPTKEQQYPCGRYAAAFLRSLVADRTVVCVEEGLDSRKRLVGTCFADGKDLGMAAVTAGWAVVTYRVRLRYIAAEDAARTAKLGIWAGSFTNPAIWRKRHK